MSNQKESTFEMDTDRRTVLKTIGAAGLASTGLAIGTGSAVARPDGPSIDITSESSGSYLLELDTETIEAGEDTPEDNIHGDLLQGDIEEGEEHVFYTDHANVLSATLRDSALAYVTDPLGMNRYGDLTVEGKNSRYLVSVTDDLDADGETGEIDHEHNFATGEGEDYFHEYDADGTINDLHSLPKFSGTSRVTFEHDI